MKISWLSRKENITFCRSTWYHFIFDENSILTRTINNIGKIKYKIDFYSIAYWLKCWILETSLVLKSERFWRFCQCLKNYSERTSCVGELVKGLNYSQPYTSKQKLWSFYLKCRIDLSKVVLEHIHSKIMKMHERKHNSWNNMYTPLKTAFSAHFGFFLS